MKRIAIAVVAALACLAAAGTAIAAVSTVNNYKASYKFSGKKKGPLSFEQTITVTPGTAGNRTGILHEINTTIDGVKVNVPNSKKYVCTAGQINNASTDAGCSKKALVATGSINATLGDATNFASPGSSCDPLLHVWNGGKGKLIFFFVEQGSHQCLNGSLHTGQVPPWTATYHQAGKNLVVDIPIPNTVDYPLGQGGGEVGSLSFEHLHWMTEKVPGNKYSIESTGCSGSKRHYTFSFNASLPGASAQTKSLKATAGCS